MCVTEVNYETILANEVYGTHVNKSNRDVTIKAWFPSSSSRGMKEEAERKLECPK